MQQEIKPELAKSGECVEETVAHGAACCIECGRIVWGRSRVPFECVWCEQPEWLSAGR